MSKPITVDILSDSDDDDHHHRNNNYSTPLPIHSKKQKTDFNSNSNPTIFVIDDDHTPHKSTTVLNFNSTPSTSLSDVSKSYGPIDSPMPDSNLLGTSGLICLESDTESEADFHTILWKQKETCSSALDVAKRLELGSTNVESPILNGINDTREPYVLISSEPLSSEDDILMSVVDASMSTQVLRSQHSSSVALPQPGDHPMEESGMLLETGNTSAPKSRNNNHLNKAPGVDEGKRKKQTSKDEKVRLMEEKKQKREQDKLQKAALKAETAEMKRLQKEKQKLENGKLALKSIVAEIDTKVIELGSVGGPLLTRLSEKGLTYRITQNPIERSIVWSMDIPEEISQVCSKRIEVPYVLLICDASDFCNLVTSEALMDHVSRVRCHYPSHTICYLTNRLMAYINKREQDQYKNPSSDSGWKRPPVEELLSKLTTHFVGVHSRLCIDEAELAEHVMGLTCSLALCQFRKKSTRLSVIANGGSLLPKDCVDRNIIKKSLWLKALIAIPKVQPRFAIAISKKYPTMKSLLSVYMDPSKSVHEKEVLLKDLTTEGLLVEDRRVGEMCSKRVYRILMAQSGTINTDDVEDGADFFNGQSS